VEPRKEEEEERSGVECYVWERREMHTVFLVGKPEGK
jgi:hypothetical protein